MSLWATPIWAGCAADTVELRWPGGTHSYEVVIADTAAKRAQGLMYVKSMPETAGMLFVYPKEQPASFWMRNTFIPLDILFFDGSGRGLTVHENAVPHDETPLFGGKTVQYVLEINGGLTAQLGITAPLELRHPAIDQNKAIWPCG